MGTTRMAEDPRRGADNPRQRQPDIAAARRRLDWEPKVTLEEGLAKTIAYFVERLRDDS